jgi:ABC-type nickel/cobalt efflux system permease component RcnA
MTLLVTPRSRVWLVVAVLFILVNVAGGVYSAWQAEWLHTGVHAVLALLGEYFVWRRLTSRRVADY